MDIKEDNNYQEGYWSARSIVEHIEKTTYKDLDTAIGTKTELLKNFEDQFGFARDMKEMDSNYSWNCGFLDYLIEQKNEKGS